MPWVNKRLSFLLSVLILAALIIPRGWVSAAGSVSLVTLGVAYTENFNTLASSGTSALVPNGWWFIETGTNANSLYQAGTGSSNAGDTYSFGPSGNTERAFGGLLSGSLTPTIGAQFVNNTGVPVNHLQIAYAGEQWRLGATGRVDRLDFQLSTDASSLTTGTWVDYDALDFTAPVTSGSIGALNGNLPQNRSAISQTITGLSIAPGATFWLRWNDFNATGADDGLAVDDFSLTPLSDPPVVSAIVRADSSPTNASDVNFSVTFSRPVMGVDLSDFDLSLTGITGASVSAVSGSGTTYTVTVNTGSGSGTLRLDVVDDDSIIDAASNPLGGSGSGNGSFTSGESYQVDKSVQPFAGGVIVNEITNGSGGSREWLELLVVGAASAVNLQGWIIDDNNGDFNGFVAGSGIAAGHLRFASFMPACPSGQSLAAAPVGSRIVIYNASDVEGALAAYPNDPCDTDGDGVYYLPVGPTPNQTPFLEQCTDRPRISPLPGTMNYGGCTYNAPASDWSPMQLANNGDAAQVRNPNGIFYHGFGYGGLNVPPAPTFPDGSLSFNISTSTGTNAAYRFICGNYFLNASGQFVREGHSLANPGLANSAPNAAFIRALQMGTLNFLDLNDVSNCRIEPTVVASFVQSQANAGQTVQLTITLTNPYNNLDGFLMDLTGVSLTNAFPTGMNLVGSNPRLNTCGGTFTGNSGAGSFSISGVDLPGVAAPGVGSCQVVVDVVPSMPGTYTNNILAGAVTSTATGVSGGSNLDDTSTTLIVGEAPLPATPSDITEESQMPATGFAPGRMTAIPRQPADKNYQELSLSLEIPSLDVEMDILGVPLTSNGWDVTWLGNSAGWLHGTSFPSWIGNAAVTAHVWDFQNRPGPFVNLHSLKWGDKVIVRVSGQQYIYEVRSLHVVAPDDLRLIRQPVDNAWLNLITCMKYDQVQGNYRNRLIVRAVLVGIE